MIMVRRNPQALNMKTRGKFTGNPISLADPDRDREYTVPKITGEIVLYKLNEKRHQQE